VSLLLPGYQDKFYLYTRPAVVGEIVFMFWLLIMGAKPPVSAAEASAAA